jgi:FMN reductase
MTVPETTRDGASTARPDTRNGKPRVVVLCGNPRPRSRTLAAAETFASALVARLRGDTTLDGSSHAWGNDAVAVVDVAKLGGAVIEGSPDVDAALATVRDAPVLVVATPVYKASYTGLLKAFLDRLAGGALAGVVAIPFTVAGSPIHRLVADVHLRPLLVELGASVPTRAFTIEEPDLDNHASVIDRWLEDNVRLVRDLVSSSVPLKG